MKKILYYFSSMLVIAAAVYFVNFQGDNGHFSTYAGSTGSPGGKTNSPGDGASCTQCHTGSLNPGSATAAINSAGLTGGYTPGQTYTISAGITGTASSKIGFEATAERDANNAKTGTMVITDATRTQTTNGGNAVTHKSAGTAAVSGSNAWSFDWTAPTAGTGNVTFYATFNVTNSSLSTSGDEIYTATFNVSEATGTGVEELNAENNISLYPNPAIDQVLISVKNAFDRIEIYDMNGKLITSVSTPAHQATIDLSQENSGIYFARIVSANKVVTEKIIKQ